MKKLYALLIVLIASNIYAQTTPTGGSSEVGVTQGELSVSLSGAANYSIPIAVPPGINGVEPEVSINYSSQAGNGYVGYGWDIGGGSSITRLPSTPYHDGIKNQDGYIIDLNIDPVDYDELDRFALDGQRLIGNNGFLVTEIFSNTKVTPIGTSPYGANYGPNSFKVEYPDGSYALYGNTTSSNTRNEWLITYWQNVSGVSINYEYTKDDATNTSVLSKIKYGSLLAGTPINEIEFIYTTRYRPEKGYVGGQLLSIIKILSQIMVKANGIGYRRYSFAYGITSLGYERLNGLNEFTGDNTKMYNPTVFTYDTTADAITYSAVNSTPIPGLDAAMSNSNTVTGDFDGDGKMDFLIYATSGAYNRNRYWVYTKLSNPAGPTITEHIYGSTFAGIFPLTYTRFPSDIVSSKTGWVVVEPLPTYLKYSQYELSYSSNTVSLLFSGTESDFGGSAAKSFYSGDFEGDGLTDVVAINQNNGQVYMMRDGGNPGKDGVIAGFSSNDTVLIGDFDGDGKSDIYDFRQNSLYVYKFDGNVELIYQITGDADIKPNVAIWMGDYNGDGKSDFICPNGSGSNIFRKYTSSGISYIKTTETTSGLFTYASTDVLNTRHYIPTDYNNDGKTDLLYITASLQSSANGAPGQVVVRCLLNKGGMFDMSAGNYTTYNTGLTSDFDTFVIPIFMTPDKLNPELELAIFRKNKIHYFKSSKNFNKERLLRTITVGSGVKETITYSPMVNTCTTSGCVPNYVPNVETEHYPNFDVGADASTMLVTTIEKQSAEKYQKQDYRYLGAVANLEGQGFLGFKAIYKTNWYTDISQLTSNVTLFDISKKGLPIKSYTYEGFGALALDYTPLVYLTSTTYVYDNELLTNKVYKIREKSTSVVSQVEGVTSGVSNTYDVYNNLATTSFYSKSGFDILKSGSATYTYDNAPTGSVYFIGRPNKKTGYVSYNGYSTTMEENYLYTNNLLTQIKSKKNNSAIITEDNVYDTFGNITKKTFTAVGLTPRVVNFEYDTTGRFLTKQKNLEGLATLYVNDANTGVLKSTTDPYGKVTTYTYDLWGKPTVIQNYLGKKVTTTYTVLPLGMYQISSIGDDGSESYTKNDDLGQSIISGVKNIDASWSYTKTAYNIYGLPISISQPYSSLSGSPTQFTTTTYDVMGRPTQINEYTGKVTNIVYDKLTTTISDGVKTNIIKKDAAGNIISNSENGQTIAYSYYPENQLKSTSFGGTTVDIELDDWGRKSKLTDPVAGVYQYAYNGFGEISTYTTPKGVVSYFYDNFGKITRKYNVETSGYGWDMTYNYDPTTKLMYYTSWYDSLGEDTGTFYMFDNYMRVNYAEDTNSLAGTSVVKTYTYNSDGEIDKETVTAEYGGQSSVTTVRNTYKNGYHWQMFDDATNTLLTELSTVTARGQVATAKLGNGMNIANTYDTYGNIQQILHSRTTPSQKIGLKTNYVFDPVRGNLTSRNNSVHVNGYEEFEYDVLDRLTKYTNIRDEQEEQVYDVKGRIASNALGSYGYDTTIYKNNSIAMSEECKAYYNYKQGIFDGTMESKTGWEFSLMPKSYDNVKKHSGNYSLQMAGTGVQSVILSSTIPIDNSAATSYTISGFAFNENTTSKVYLIMYNAAGTTSELFLNTSGLNTWTGFSQAFSVPSTIKKLSLRLEKATGGKVWFDDIIIMRTADITTDRKLDVTYNMFKAPTEIIEPGVDRISFTYNGEMGRSAMYYGSMASDRYLRPYRKFYSVDGTVEIKHNIVDNTIEFITYLGGDGYTAPVVYKAKGTVKQYLYLHRDYQGSILSISDQSANILERRIFDAWGNIKDVRDGVGQPLAGLTILDRGYTGHEHLQSVALINMNGRLYDPKLHRFLQPDNNIQDPFNTQNYNRYSYVYNNPLKYTDPTGETAGGEPDNNNWYDSGLLGGLIKSVVGNYEPIKKFFTTNNLEHPFNEATKWLVKQIGTVASWAASKLRSFDDLISQRSHEKIVQTPMYSAPVSNGGWQGGAFKFAANVNGGGGKGNRTPKGTYVQPRYIPAPNDLPGFPGSIKLRNKRGARPAWRLPDGGIGEWDHQHGEVEIYDKTGKKHKGAFNPDTGEEIPGKQDDGRTATRAKYEVRPVSYQMPHVNYTIYSPIILNPPTPRQTLTVATAGAVTLFILILLSPAGI